MSTTCIAVADATRARLFTFERTVDGSGPHDTFSERADLVNLARRETPAELFSDTRTNSSRTGGRHYGYDDHRDAHVDELDTAFAREIVQAIDALLHDTGATRLIVCAPPRMLGMLRRAQHRRIGVVVVEVDHDYTKLATARIHDQLIERGVLPVHPPRTLARGA